MTKKILITGATGFCGSHVLESLKKEYSNKYNIIATCRDTNKLPIKYRDTAIEGNLLDTLYLDTITKEADVICHTASWAELNGNSEDSDREFLKPTLKLINKALENSVKRFVFLSAITSNPIKKEQIHSSLELTKIWTHYANIIKIEEYLKSIGNYDMEIVILRVGLFTGKNYALGILPILLPRLKTHLVPWIDGGLTSLPLIDGEDIGLAFSLASTKKLENNYYEIDIVGKEIPSVKEVFEYLHQKHDYPLPHFSVSFSLAYLFARFMRFIYKIIPQDPLIVPAIILLLEETHSNNNYAREVLRYKPKVHWKDSIDTQITQMQKEQKPNMKMNKK